MGNSKESIEKNGLECQIINTGVMFRRQAPGDQYLLLLGKADCLIIPAQTTARGGANTPQCQPLDFLSW